MKRNKLSAEIRDLLQDTGSFPLFVQPDNCLQQGCEGAVTRTGLCHDCNQI